MTGARLAEFLAATIEHRDGLPCGGCGRRHVEAVADLERMGDACTCQCCRGVSGELVHALCEREYPGLITVRGGRRIITAAAFAEMTRRIEVEITSLARPVAETRRGSQ